MPWKETCIVEQRKAFIGLWLSGRYTKSALCEQFGISRVTGDKWFARHAQFGMDGLYDRSSAPNSHPNATRVEICELLVAEKRQRPSWGSKKLLDLLRRKYPDVHWPADSTGDQILKRAGLVRPRRIRRLTPADYHPFSSCDAPNTCWSADFKGDFRLGNAQRCYPLTISDNCSRYLLACQALARTSTQTVQPWFERVFQEYGLPWVIRSDNGAPFASRAIGGLSQLSKWWIDLGIRPERIEPGRPDQNGRHERMHRSLKAWLNETAWSIEMQQHHLDRFRYEYNEERSHESLERQTPAQMYKPSMREYPRTIETAQYGSDMTVRRVRSTGQIKWQGHLLYISEVLANEWIGLEPSANGLWNIFYRFHPLGQLDERSNRIIPISHWHGKYV